MSLVWFTFDFSSYSFSLYSSKWVSIILGDNSPLWKSFGLSTVIYLFNLPGAFSGAFMSDWMAFMSDWIGPANALALGAGLQGIVGFIMAGCYGYLSEAKNVAAFVVVYG